MSEIVSKSPIPLKPPVGTVVCCGHCHAVFKTDGSENVSLLNEGIWIFYYIVWRIYFCSCCGRSNDVLAKWGINGLF